MRAGILLRPARAGWLRQCCRFSSTAPSRGAEAWVLHSPRASREADLVRLGLESHRWTRRPGPAEVWQPSCGRPARITFVPESAPHPDCPPHLSAAGRSPGFGMAAVVGGELVLAAETDPGGLMYDLDQIGLLPADTAAAFAAATSRANAASRGGRAGDWWQAPAAAADLRATLQQHHAVVLDDFLPPHAAASVAAAAKASRGSMERGEHGLPDSASDSQQELWKTIRTAWSSPRVRGDHLVFWNDRLCPDLAARTALISSMEVLCKGALRGLEGVDDAWWCSEPQVACYPAGPGRYCKHTDDGACPTGRVLTMIYYCNPDWDPNDGGDLRIYAPGLSSGRVVSNIAPLSNRLVVFRSDPRVPHEVLASRRDRYAVTVWSYDAKAVLRLPDTLTRVLNGQMMPFGGSRQEALAASAASLGSQKEALNAMVAALGYVEQQQQQQPPQPSCSQPSQRSLAYDLYHSLHGPHVARLP